MLKIVTLTKYGNMNVMLNKGSFMLREADDSGKVYCIQASESILIPPHESYIIDTGIYVNLPDGCEGYLIPRSELGICTVIDKTYVGRVDGTGNESIRVSMHGGNTVKYVYKGDIIGKLVIRPSHTPELEIRRAKSGKQYLVLCIKDGYVILDDDGYPVKIPTDIVESLELVDIVHTIKELEYFLENTGAQRKYI